MAQSPASTLFRTHVIHPEPRRPENLDDTLAAPTATAARPTQTAAGRTTVLPRESSPELGVDGDARTRFEQRSLLGEGGMGAVTLEFDRDIGRVVAVKRLRADMADATALLRFAEEVRTVGTLEHPGIAPVHDVGIDEAGRHYFVMKYVAGETLETVIEQLAAKNPVYEQRYSIERRAEICMKVMEAIAFAHDKGVVHRDIKPANVMIGEFGEVNIIDWGIAHNVREGATATRKTLAKSEQGLLGTPLYMSPEQAMGKTDTLDARSDVYSLAVMFHELFVLRHYLHDATTVQMVIAGILVGDRNRLDLTLDTMNAAFPNEFIHWVAKGMRKDPSERYASVGEMMAALERARMGLFPVQCPCTFVKRGAHGLLHFADRHPLIMIASVVLGGLLLLASVVIVLVRLIKGF